MLENINNQEQIRENITEKDFLAYFNNQEFELLSKWLVKTAVVCDDTNNANFI